MDTDSKHSPNLSGRASARPPGLWRRSILPRTVSNPILYLLVIAGFVACEPPTNPASSSDETTQGASENAPPPPQDDDQSLNTELSGIFLLIQRGSTGPARVRLVKYGKLNPDDGHAAFLMGLTYHVERRYAMALPHFEQARALTPGHAATSHFLGWARLYLGDLEGAAAAFADHLTADPDEGDSHFGLGLIAMEHDDVAEAERRFSLAIELQRDTPSRRRELAKAHVRLADVRARQDRINDARQLLEDAIAIYPDHYEAHYRLARILQRVGETDRATLAMTEFRVVYDRLYPNRPQYRE